MSTTTPHRGDAALDLFQNFYISDIVAKLGYETAERKLAELTCELIDLRKDKARLDSRTIRMIHRDDLGADVAVIHMDIDLREAIDKAVEAGK